MKWQTPPNCRASIYELSVKIELQGSWHRGKGHKVRPIVNLTDSLPSKCSLCASSQRLPLFMSFLRKWAIRMLTMSFALNERIRCQSDWEEILQLHSLHHCVDSMLHLSNLTDSCTYCAYIPAIHQYSPSPGSHTEIHQGLAVSFVQCTAEDFWNAVHKCLLLFFYIYTRAPGWSCGYRFRPENFLHDK